MAEEANKPNGTPGTFTSKNIVLPKGVTDYTVRISSADNQRLGMGYQSPHNHYALPISGLEFSISQDTSNLAKNLLQRIYNKLKETESTDKSQKTGDSASNYENKLNEIDALLKSSDLKTTAEYKRLSLDLLNAKEQLKEVTPDAPTVAVDSDQAQEGGSKNQSFTTQVDRNKLPNTGSTDTTAMMIVGTASALLGIGLTGRRRKED